MSEKKPSLTIIIGTRPAIPSPAPIRPFRTMYLVSAFSWQTGEQVGYERFHPNLQAAIAVVDKLRCDLMLTHMRFEVVRYRFDCTAASAEPIDPGPVEMAIRCPMCGGPRLAFEGCQVCGSG